MKGLIRRIVLSGLCLVAVQTLASSESEISLGTPDIDPSDQVSLQRGAKYYMNYCSGCHSLKYVRYERLARDIGITKNDGSVAVDLMRDNLIFDNSKIFDQIHVAMKPDDGQKWFGVTPPDLTLEARARGVDWLYSYLMGFYTDSSRPWGVNNVMLPNVAMPDVVVGLQGKQEPIYRLSHEEDGTVSKSLVGLRLVEQGTMTPEQYRVMVDDIVNFLAYVGNPVKSESHRIGLFVFLFLVVLLSLSWALKREYWKDVH